MRQLDRPFTDDNNEAIDASAAFTSDAYFVQHLRRVSVILEGDVGTEAGTFQVLACNQTADGNQRHLPGFLTTFVPMPGVTVISMTGGGPATIEFDPDGYKWVVFEFTPAGGSSGFISGRVSGNGPH